MEEQKEELLPLDLPERAIVLNSPNGVHRHIFRRIVKADAEAYNAEKVVESRRQGQSVEDRGKIYGPEIRLYDRAAIRVEGYPKLTDGRDFMALTNWKERVKGERLSAIQILTKIETSAASPEALAIDPEFDVVSIDSLWSQVPAGGMRCFVGLLHRFTPPKQQHWDRLGDFRTSTIAVGGSRGGLRITRYPNSFALMTELYDELIASVDGYSVGGSPLVDRRAIAEQMDPFHKLKAVAMLFSAAEGDGTEAE